MQTDVRRQRVESLTGLRWFAALAVFGYHANQFLALPVVGEAMRLGDAGVTFFYVLSGFVLTWSFSPRVTITTFWWRRFARIWPMLALSMPIAWFCFSQQWRESWLPTLFGLSLVESWLRPAAAFVGNPVSWSVSCEAFFYLMFPFLIRPVLRLSLRMLAVLAGAMVAVEFGYWYLVVERFVPPGSPDFWINLSWFLRFPPYRLAEFVLGMIAAAALLRGWRPRVNLWVALGTVPVTALILVFGTRKGWWPDLWSQQALLVSCVLVVVAAASRDMSGRPSFLSSRPLVALGRWSYAFYLVHLGVIFMFRDLGTPLYLSWANVRAILVWAVVAVALAAVCYQFFERPAEAWLRRLPVRGRHAAPRACAQRTSSVRVGAADSGESR
jgi:peptidoglycan/LPS O-acetylase OafA/YrhL